MGDSETSVGNTTMLQQIEIKKVLLGLLISIKVDKSLRLYVIYPSSLSEAGEEIARSMTKISVSSPATGKVLED